MFSNIIVPLDGTSFSEAELSYALALLPEGGKGHLILAMATDEPPPVSDGDFLRCAEQAHNHCTSYLCRLVDEIRRIRPWLVVRARVLEGKPEKVIARIAKEELADLIIMASHSEKGLARWLLGSVTEGVLRETTVPVLVVHPNNPSTESPLFSEEFRQHRPDPDTKAPSTFVMLTMG